LKPAAKTAFVELAIPTREGEFVARYSVKGLAGLKFPPLPAPRKKAARPAVPGELPMTIRRWHRATAVALKRALAGRPPRLLPPLDLSAGTAFQQRVWNALLKIPRGRTRSYGELAQAVRAPQAARAVGQACGANPIPVFVPCHRVLAAGRKLGGFSSGLDWKRELLWREESRDWWENPL
jgi:methylated-DNA-[protein]-cysteine S-methyltransferase